MDRIVERLGQGSKIAADYGMNICWEFEPGFAFNKPSEIVQIVDAVRAKGNTNFGVLYDTCHAHMCAVVGGQPGRRRRRRCPAASWSCSRSSRGRSPTST